MKQKLSDLIHKFFEGLSWKMFGYILLGAAICTFGVHNIHQRCEITEGGMIGTMLLIEHWLELSPSVITPILDVSCYLLAFKYLGGRFIKMSAIATVSVSFFYKIWESFPPMLPDLSDYPAVAAVLGGAFVGVGTGIILRQGGSSGGDDALALTISRITHWRLASAYLFADFVILGLSLTYIPAVRIAISLLTVFTSSFLIDAVKNFQWKKGVSDLEKEEAPSMDKGK